MKVEDYIHELKGEFWRLQEAIETKEYIRTSIEWSRLNHEAREFLLDLDRLYTIDVVLSLRKLIENSDKDNSICIESTISKFRDKLCLTSAEYELAIGQIKEIQENEVYKNGFKRLADRSVAHSDKRKSRIIGRNYKDVKIIFDLTLEIFRTYIFSRYYRDSEWTPLPHNAFKNVLKRAENTFYKK
jgi:hypothetical protein